MTDKHLTKTINHAIEQILLDPAKGVRLKQAMRILDLYGLTIRYEVHE